MVVGPNGSYLTAWCQLRGDERVFRMDRITRAVPTPAPHRAPQVIAENHQLAEQVIELAREAAGLEREIERLKALAPEGP